MLVVSEGSLEPASIFSIVFSRMRVVLVALISVLGVASLQADSAEQQIIDSVKAPKISVVHLWAPWCSNCHAELKSGGWARMIKDNPTVQFYFVSVWNGGEDGRAMLQKFEIGGQPNVTIAADPGPRGQNHIKQFAGLPVSWIPTTWVYKSGELRYALNYGEIHFDVLQQMIADSDAGWSHKGEKTETN